jgi:hypothetical protein
VATLYAGRVAETERSPQLARPGTGVVPWLERWGIAASFAWGLAEATLFFIVPDVIVGAVALVAPRKAVRAAGAAVAGAVAGGAVLFVWAQVSEPSVRAAIDGVPAVPARMFVEAGRALAENGGVVMLAAAFTGIPYKVWALEMIVRGWSLPSLAAWTIPARAVRLGLVAGVAALVGWLARRQIARRPWPALGVWLAFWVVVYVDYWTRVGF